MNLRCFIAIEIPMLLRKKIARTTFGGLDKNVQLPRDALLLVNEDNLHITLKFLGDVPQDRLSMVEQRLAGIQAKPFRVKIKGAGVFPNENYVRVVWVGCAGKELDELAEKINEALTPLFKPEEFTAHITIARVKRKISVKAFLEANKDNRFGEFRAERFLLMMSKLTPKGPEYSVLSEFRLE